MVIKRISPCPIIEAVVQVNCTFVVDQDVVVGMVYSMLQEAMQEVKIDSLRIEKLPIMNLPEEIRRADMNLRDKPWYKIECGEYFILIGIFGVAFGVNPPYKGWEAFKDFSVKIFDLLRNNVVKEVGSVMLKYLDFFPDVNILEKVNCEFCVNRKAITAVPTIFRTELPEGDFVKILQITNGVHLQNQVLGIDSDGSLIEISLFAKGVSMEDFDRVIEDAHSKQKQDFFSLLSTEYLNTFEVEYE